MTKSQGSAEDLLRVEGVGVKGFGIVPRYAMCDPELSWSGKVLYAYLCAMAGNGNQTFPRRETVIRCLGIGKDTYYRGQKELTARGYITVESTRNRNHQGVNIYTLVSNPLKYIKNPVSKAADKAMVNRVIARGLKAGGYGMLPRLVMQDERLCAKTKLVYAYLSSYAGAGCTAFPTTGMALSQLQVSKDAWRRAIRELEQCCYISVTQRRIRGRFDVYDYELLDSPQKHKRRRHPPKTDNKDTETQPETSLPDTDFKDTVTIPEAGSKDTEPEAGNKDTETQPETGLPDADFKDTEPEAGNKDTETQPETENKDTETQPETENKDTETPPEAGLPDADFKDTNLSTVLSINNIRLSINNISSSSNITPSVYQQRPDETAQSPAREDRGTDFKQESFLCSDCENEEAIDPQIVKYGSEDLAILADALNNEFGRCDMEHIQQLLSGLDIPGDQNMLPGHDAMLWGRHRYLREKYMALNAICEKKARRGESPIKNRCEYFKVMLKSDIARANQ